MSKKNDQSHHIRLYVLVFGALMCFTVITVMLSYLDLPHSVGIPLGIAVAVFKAGLVAAIFMHLKWEKPLIYGLLGLTVFLGAGLIAIAVDVMGYRDQLAHIEAPASETAAHGEVHH